MVKTQPDRRIDTIEITPEHIAALSTTNLSEIG